jgi:prepilin-type N-terminal cleavage/methylation domain-containing protein
MSRMSRRGMTLLELVVAMAVGMLVVTVSARALHQSWQAREQVRTEVDRLAAARGAFLLLTRELEQARPGDLRVERRPGLATPRLETGSDVPMPLLVSYQVREQVLRRRERLRFAAHDDTRDVALLGGVREFDVRCLADGEWHASWDRPALPEAFHVTLELTDDVHLDTIIVPVAAGSG